MHTNENIPVRRICTKFKRSTVVYYKNRKSRKRHANKDEDAALKAKAKDLWYVPNPKDASEVEKLRERALLKEYENYKTEKKIKTPRLEALRVGFQKSYEEHDYATIVSIAKKVPSDVVETDEKLLRYYDRAQLHLDD